MKTSVVRRLNVYIAAPFQMQEEIRNGIAKQLEERNVNITSRWLTVEPIEKTSDEAHSWALKDLYDVDQCDALLAWNPPDWRLKGSGGRHVELGYALAKDKGIVIVGDRSSIFHHLYRIYQLDFGSSVKEIHDALYNCIGT